MDLQQKIIDVPGYKKVVNFTDKDSGLNAIIAIHSTTLGPGLGGTRIYPYAKFEDALTDVLRLSRGMTYKAGIAQVGIGGAKSVIITAPKTGKSPELLAAFAEAVNTFEGEYICAEDVGCSPEDIDIILKTTKYACGVHNLRGGGNPAQFTAWGVYRGIQSVLQETTGSSSVKGKTIAVQGAGNVGKRLIERLFWEGAKIIISDVNEDVVKYYVHQYGVEAVGLDEIHAVECDVFSPNALGGTINSKTIPELKCSAVAGGANNQLLEPSDADHLAKKGILYAPDFVINSGGLINVISELSQEGYNGIVARDMTSRIYDQLLEIYEIAQQNKISTHQAAVSIVDHRLKQKIGKREQELSFHN